MIVRSVGRLLLVAFAAASSPGCGDAAPTPSVLLVTIDTLRADAVSAWGIEAGTTPHLDALAARGLRYARASTVTPLTLPTHASLLTGWRPGRHGLTVNGVARASLPVSTLAERLSDEGFGTAAFVSSTVLDRRHGLAAGFGHYDDRLFEAGGPPSPTERRGDRTVDRALAWNGWSNGPVFAWVHLFDPHAPYEAPGGRTTNDRAAYLDEVRFADAQLGRLLDGVAARADGPVLVVVTSDHGEGLGEHDEATHGLQLHETTVHVPLVVAWLDGATDRGYPRPGVVDVPVSLLDVAPTLLARLGLPAIESADGTDLSVGPALRALPLETRAPWFYYGFSALVGVRRGAQKLVGAPDADDAGWTLFDLDADPRELRGVPHAETDLIAAVRSPDPVVEGAVVGDRSALAALGYLGADPRADDGEARADPRDETELLHALDAANTAIVGGEAELALAHLAGLPPRHAEVPERLYLEGRALMALGRFDQAAAVLARACTLRPTAALHVEWGLALLSRDGGGPEAALALDRALAVAPGDPRAIAFRAMVELAEGRPELALARVEPALAGRPRDADLLTVALRAQRALGREAQAAQVAERLAAVWPDHPDL